MSYVIGLDIGTTSVKAVLMDEAGKVLAELEKGYPILQPYKEWAEQNPLAIERAAIFVLKGILGEHPVKDGELTGVGLSSAMHTLICMGQNGHPLSNSVIWADTRSKLETENLKVHHPDIYYQTGTPLHPMTPLSKLIWMKNTDYEPFKQADKYISIKEFIIKRWFNIEIVDYSVAASSGLFDIRELTWNKEALKKAGITRENLYTPVPPTYSFVGLKEEIAQETGINSNTPFTIGASDGPLANIGVGAIEEGDTVITIGTSGAIRQFTQQPLLNDKQEVFSYRFDETTWITGGASNNGGNVFPWLQKIFKTEKNPFHSTMLNEMAEKSPVGANRLLFLPYLHAERAPIWDGEAKAGFIGLSVTHQKEDLIRAVMEGVIFNIFQISQALEGMGNNNEHLFVNGGFTNSALWVQILVDIFGQKVKLPVSYQSSACGAAWLALQSNGRISSLMEIKQVIQMKETVKPNMENHKKYQKMYPIYKEVYMNLRGIFNQLNRL